VYGGLWHKTGAEALITLVERFEFSTREKRPKSGETSTFFVEISSTTPSSGAGDKNVKNR